MICKDMESVQQFHIVAVRNSACVDDVLSQKLDNFKLSILTDNLLNIYNAFF